MAPRFVDSPLRIITPGFDSPLTDVVIELERLRHPRLPGDTPLAVFLQLKEIFHTLESLGSARIEGNHTTLADYIESKIDTHGQPTDPIMEVNNIERAMAYIEDSITTGGEITEYFIRELHQMAVTGLQREGDEHPGRYRPASVRIGGAEHLPPEATRIPDYMRELADFINRADAPKYDLLKMALAHHRFLWIHPFGNGNGRTVRLLSYAMLIKYGFNVQAADLRVVTKVSPTAEQVADLLFAYRVAKFVKSNAIVFCGHGMTLGVGAGQMSRVDSTRIAAAKAQAAGLELSGSCAASDAFFPFRDGLDVVAEAGATAVIQPGGSLRDDEVITAADEHGLAMVFTGTRHFRH